MKKNVCSSPCNKKNCKPVIPEFLKIKQDTTSVHSFTFGGPPQTDCLSIFATSVRPHHACSGCIGTHGTCFPQFLYLCPLFPAYCTVV